MVNDFLFAGFCGLTLDLQAQREACLGAHCLAWWALCSPSLAARAEEGTAMDTAASLAAGLTKTQLRGWLVVLFSRLQGSSVVLISYSFGMFLPFIRADLQLSPLEAGLLQSAWWVTSAVLALPCSVWFSRFRPVPLVLVSLCTRPTLPRAPRAGREFSRFVLFLARCFFVLCHVIATPARPLLFQQWVAPKQYAVPDAGDAFCLHSVLLATAISTSAWLITAAGSWRLVYGMLSAFLLVQTLLWWVVAREERAPVQGLKQALEAPQDTPLRALRVYPQGWLVGVTMFALSATWTAIVAPLLPSCWSSAACLQDKAGNAWAVCITA